MYLVLEFTHEMQILEDFSNLIDDRVLDVRLESEYDFFNYNEIV